MYYIILAYFLWGTLAIYWKQLGSVPSLEILAHRIIWSFVFLSILILLSRNRKVFLKDIVKIRKHPKMIFWIFVATLFLNINWLTYIWAINHAYIVQTSLGYYINPIMTVLLGVFVLSEKLTRLQWLSFFIVLVGVAFLTYQVGSFPLISFMLAISFSLYSLIKKKIPLLSLSALTIETFISAIPAIIYLVWIGVLGRGSFHFTLAPTTLLLIGAGVVTAMPLLLFNLGTKCLPLNLIGIFQYISPTMTLMIGIFIYHEKFTLLYLAAFIIIWLGLVLFISQTMQKKRVKSSSNPAFMGK
jgi:chloramphenicol-sensitive protein RarD